jgi:hypothetical protein
LSVYALNWRSAVGDDINSKERLFQDAVEHIAKMNQWKVQHVQPMKSSRGNWMTGGSPGFPDLVLAHPQRGLIFAELKLENTKLSDEQVRWAQALMPWCEYYVWRPSMIDLIAARLGRIPEQ